MIQSLFYNVGKFGPVILAIFSLYLLFNKKNLLVYYLVGFMFNSIINLILQYRKSMNQIKYKPNYKFRIKYIQYVY